MSDIVRPTRSDPLVTAASESVGGPVGTRAGGHPWWTPVRVVLAVAALAFVLGMVQKTPVRPGRLVRGQAALLARCATRTCPTSTPGAASRPATCPYADNGGRYQAMEYPVVIGYFAYGAAWITHDAGGSPDLTERRAVAGDQVYGAARAWAPSPASTSS